MGGPPSPLDGVGNNSELQSQSVSASFAGGRHLESELARDKKEQRRHEARVAGNARRTREERRALEKATTALKDFPVGIVTRRGRRNGELAANRTDQEDVLPPPKLALV